MNQKSKFRYNLLSYLNLMDSLDNFPKDLKEKSGGFIIVDKIEGEAVILLGKSNISNKKSVYENFGGRYEKEDISSLHTGVRELIEEFFNLKVPVNVVNIIALGLRTNNLIIKQHELNGMAYLINFEGLNFIFQNIVDYNKNLLKYNINQQFDYLTYISERIVTEKANNGLNEIHRIELFKVKDVKDNKVNLRWYTNKIINLMID